MMYSGGTVSTAFVTDSLACSAPWMEKAILGARIFHFDNVSAEFESIEAEGGGTGRAFALG